MHYTEFQFKNFKGIEDMTLRLTGGVTTLIGLNESGKTTILEAIYCFSYGAEDLDAINPGMALLRDREQWIPISRRANFNDVISITAVVALDEVDKQKLRQHFHKRGTWLTTIPSEVSISESHEFENSRYIKTTRFWAGLTLHGTTGNQRKPRVFSGNTSAEWHSAVNFITTLLPRIFYFPNFLFELPERFQLKQSESSPVEEQDKNLFYRTTFENVIAQLGYGATLQTHVVDRLQSTERADQRSLTALLLDMGRLITNIVFEGWNRIFGRDPVAQEVQLTAEPEDDDGAALELKIKGPDGYYDLAERSLGFRWFFMFLLMTSFQGKGDAQSKPLFLLDEPASNLHSSAQAELLKSFESLLSRCSLVYATHSHHLINIRWLDAAYVVKNAALGSLTINDYMASRIGAHTSITATPYRRFVVEHPDQTSYFQPVLDLLDYRPSDLEPIPNVVLVEGKSDFYILRYITEVVGLQSELRFVPGTGAGSLDTVIRLHIGWGKSFLILLDGDAEGVKQRARYERTFGVIIKDRCILLPDACGDSRIKEAEHLLSDSDKTAIISAVFLEGTPRPGSKKALREAVMELYSRRARVKIEPGTMGRFQSLLSVLDGGLKSQI